MRPFILSCDAHIAEPNDLFTANMTGDLAQYAPNAVVDGNVRITRLGERVLMKIQADFFAHKVTPDDVDTGRRGARDVMMRLQDMDRDGVDAEAIFPSLGLMVSRIEDAEASRVACQVYNDWLWQRLDGLRNTLIPVAIVPNVNIPDAVTELKRVIEIGFRAVMMPCAVLDSCPQYNDPEWDTFFSVAEANEIPLLFHTAVGKVNIRAMRGPGGAVFNYTRQMSDAIEATAALVAGGVLDRHPGVKIMFLECGAGWLLSLG
ncbi:MAG: amidohydrolase family protein, partial [Actinomycetota bacterium]|nr:amidohydrolase family protein [Actinomycetota bacterium]